jgi:hypothetical protein
MPIASLGWIISRVVRLKDAVSAWHAYRDVGLRLQELRHNREQAELATILWHECGLSLPRAYQLMALATGTKRLDELRAPTITPRTENSKRR